MLPAVLGANLVAYAGMRQGTPTILTLSKTLQSPELAPGKEGQPWEKQSCLGAFRDGT